MNPKDPAETLKTGSLARKSFGLLVTGHGTENEDNLRSVAGLTEDDIITLFVNGELFVYGPRAVTLYKMVGPEKTSGLYALLCNPLGNLITENT